MTDPNYKTLLTPQFVKDLRSVFNSVGDNLEEIRENLNNDFLFNGTDLWGFADYFISDLEQLTEYLEENK